MRVLVVLSSSNQMYSGIGRNVFELARRMKDRVAFEFAIDDGNARNTDLVARFGAAEGMPVHVGAAFTEPDALDFGNRDLPRLLSERRWDALECVCFANAATNNALMEHVGETTLVYTPHDQPLWTVPMAPHQARRIEEVHGRLLEVSDLVLCDSLAERDRLQSRSRSRSGRAGNCVHLLLGCDFNQFRSGPAQRDFQLLFVGDLREPRKRFDRVLALFWRLRKDWPELKLRVVGNRSDQVQDLIPEELAPAVSLSGYVTEAELREAYARSFALVLLSDFEAFGIPILEALASGTPVFLSEQAETGSIFGGCTGAHFCPSEDAEATARVVAAALERGRHTTEEAILGWPRLRAAFDWENLAARKWKLMSGAWLLKRGFALSA